MKIDRQSDGTYPAYAWPGGYPLYYLDREDNILCPTCASQETNPVEGQVYYEGSTLQCDECFATIESAYGDPEAEQTEPAEDEPAEDDYTTSDYCTFYQYGKLAVSTEADHWQTAIAAHMDQQQMWPNVWHISDHGNAHLLSVE